MYFTYILKSIKDGRRYIGFTNNIELRLEFHNRGINPSTKNRRPFKLICFWQFQTRIEAMKYERHLKSLKGGKQLDIEIKKMLNNAVVAQLVEQLHGNDKVAGSKKHHAGDFITIWEMVQRNCN